MAGMEASTMTSDGTCRLVMPLSESTIARAGPSAISASKEALISAPMCGTPSRPFRMVPRPSFGDRPAATRTSPYFAKVFGKKARTTWPKTIGSETFIIVALRCTENRTSSALARAICASRKVRSASTCRTDASTTSPARTGTDARRTVVAPSAATCSMRSVPASAITADFSVERKSSAPMVATFVFDSEVQAPMRCGWALA